MECLKGLTAMNKKILDKRPLKYSLVLNISCLDPRKMSKKLEICVPITQELLKSANSARSRYRDYQEQQKRKQKTDEEKRKRKRIENTESLKKKAKTLKNVIENLEESADKISEEAEKSKTKNMAQKVAQANALRSKRKEKTELQTAQVELEETKYDLKNATKIPLTMLKY
ncbi:UNVERIFIED_CONTAM: hypothetical protein FKN15_038605 [Acipenser sinensis]